MLQVLAPGLNMAISNYFYNYNIINISFISIILIVAIAIILFDNFISVNYLR